MSRQSSKFADFCLEIAFSASCVVDAGSWKALKDKGFANGNPRATLLGRLVTPIYVVQSLFVRAAYTVFYLRIIPSELGFRWHRRIILIAFGVYAVYILSYGIFNIFKCGSPANLGDPDAICVKISTRGVLFDVAYCCDAGLDWTLALVPMDVVRRTVHSKRTRNSIIYILTLGCVASTIAVIIPPLNQLANKVNGDGENLLWPITVDTLAFCEALLAIVCLCLAALKPLFKEYLDPMLVLRSTQQSTQPSLPTISLLPTRVDSPFEIGLSTFPQRSTGLDSTLESGLIDLGQPPILQCAQKPPNHPKISKELPTQIPSLKDET
ncbi:hypothetical protein K461DRAFT_295549 [Myriangium duriaei CBS 260.36]|uniref:Rhodopsin domain-containing protein n=1 Tax=Myriangium duriaei CBS 260.36 TaxID=1168546 RepID=A0A9P4J327_9PEZI|nr:hypothetical protein K461DRAFT_295549 [Myriangium duriaei CBS 260.36]